MPSEHNNSRNKPAGTPGRARRTNRVPVRLGPPKKRHRRTGLTRRLELRTAGDQIQAALDLLSRALDHGVLFDEDRWLLETAITRLRSALGPLESEAGGDRA